MLLPIGENVAVEGQFNPFKQVTTILTVKSNGTASGVSKTVG